MKKKRKTLPNLKKEIEAFLSEEEAKIVKKKALKLGIGAAALSSLLPKITKAFTSHVSHSSCHSSCHSSRHSKSHASCVGAWDYHIAICR